jgi:hypothetical protein
VRVHVANAREAARPLFVVVVHEVNA